MFYIVLPIGTNVVITLLYLFYPFIKAPQKGISGTGSYGADAIIVSGGRKDGIGYDTFDNLLYAAEWRIGGNALWTSYVEQYPVRVFRSSQYRQSQFRACAWQQPQLLPLSGFGPRTVGSLNNDERKNNNNKVTSYLKSYYRYDGLYRIVRVHPPEHSGAPMFFFLTRIDGSGTNEITTDVLKGRILVERQHLLSRTPESRRSNQQPQHSDAGRECGDEASQKFSFLFQPFQGVPMRKGWASKRRKSVDELVVCRTMLDLRHERPH
jgi:hypothetical protein